MLIGKFYVYTSPLVNLTISSCTRGTTELFYPTKETQTAFFQMHAAQNTLTLPNFGCTYDPCCLGLETGLTKQDIETTNFEKDGFTNYTYV